MMTLCRQPFIPILLVSQSLLTISFPSFPTPVDSPNNVQRIFWPFTNSDNYLEMFADTNLPMGVTTFTETVEAALYAADSRVRHEGNNLVPTAMLYHHDEGDCSIVVRPMILRAEKFKFRDWKQALLGFQLMLVGQAMFFETFFYVRGRAGVAIADGIVTAGELPPQDDLWKYPHLDLLGGRKVENSSRTQ